MRDYSEWKAALRLQIEALARRNDLHRRCNRNSVKTRTQEMDNKILKLREMLQHDANKCAQYYLECVCHADETERILNRTSSRMVKKKHIPRGSVIESPSTAIMTLPASATNTITPSEADNKKSDRVPHDKRWWEQLSIHRREEYYAEGKHEVRQMFRTQKDFFMSCIGLIVGIGNVIRFPACIYQFDGGIFLIPYITCHLFIGFPLLYLQLAIGQWSGLSMPAALEALAPIASGVGWVFIIMGIIFAIYLNIYVAWGLHFMLQSIRAVFSGVIPWEVCSTAMVLGKSCCDLDNLSNCSSTNSSIIASEAYFLTNIIPVQDPFDYSISLQGYAVICFLISWLLTTVGSLRFTHSTGLGATLAVVTPFVFLFILFLRGIALPGAHTGISFLLNIDTELLFVSGIWRAAVQQVFYELTLNTAPIVTFSALSRFKNNIYRDSVLLVSISVLTSILSALVVFSYLGYFSSIMKIPLQSVVATEPHYLSFYIYTAITSTLKGGAFWSFCTFAVLVFITLDAQYALMEMIATSVLTKLSSLNRRLQNKLIIACCLIGFILGLPFCTKGGMILFHTMDNLIACAVPCILSISLILIVTQIYGVKEIVADISYMIRIPVLPMRRFAVLDTSSKLQAIFGPTGLFIKYCWIFMTPSLLIILLFLHITDYKLINLAGKPVSFACEFIAWVILSFPIVLLPLLIIQKVSTTRRAGKTVASLFDSNVWTQMHRLEPVQPSSGEGQDEQVRRRRTAMRENTYVYIDAQSRGNTTREVPVDSEDTYGWRMGRLQDMQDTQEGSSVPRDPSSISSDSDSPSLHSRQSSQMGEITLFGSPPASNAFMLAEIISERNRRDKVVKLEKEESKDFETISMPSQENLQTLAVPLEPPAKLYRKSFSSDPPLMRPFPINARTSPCRSEPPKATERRLPAVRSRSESHNHFSEDSDSDCDSNGIRRERRTVIRRLPSEDLQSTSNAGIARQRSLSSVAIFNNDDPRPKNKLSQLKRPAPINVPPTRF
ncbi:unnamed protein product [Auanema sp. JU1783]|nr:unnamed protein product [Auanema sp. JU1783]